MLPNLKRNSDRTPDIGTRFTRSDLHETTFLSFLFTFFIFSSAAEARVYLDVNAPTLRSDSDRSSEMEGRG